MPGGRRPGVLAGCSALQEFEDQLFCRAGVQRSDRSLRGQLCRKLGVPELFTSSRLGEVKIFEFGIGSFRVSRCFGCHFFGRRGPVGVFPEDG